MQEISYRYILDMSIEIILGKDYQEQFLLLPFHFFLKKTKIMYIKMNSIKTLIYLYISKLKVLK